MQNYSIAEIQDRASEVLEQAAIAPIVLTAGSKPNYVIMSAQGYQQLLERLEALEDTISGSHRRAL